MPALVEGPHTVDTRRFVLAGHDGTSVDAVHARPDGVATGGLVVHPDIMGVRPLFDDLARRLATHGYAVCALEPFARLPAAERVDLDAAGRMQHVKELDDTTQIGDLARAADYLVVEDGVTTMSVMGFCMGGMYTFKAAASGRFDRAVAFYGMLRVPDAWRGPGQRDPLDLVPDMCPTLAIFGDQDPWAPMDDIEELRKRWAGREDCEIVVYPGAEHGFVHDAERPAHRPADAADAWKRALAFLGAGTSTAGADR